MAYQQVPRHPEAPDRQVVDCGGLRFEATFRAPAGATLPRLWGGRRRYSRAASLR